MNSIGIKPFVGGLFAASLAFLFISGAQSRNGQAPVAVAAGIDLQPVLTGLSQPVFLTNAHDGSRRLFIVEQPGVIKVLQPGSTTPTVFLDNSARVLSGGEQGLLGLAFHPQYAQNRRFFVDYTRQPDGATVIAEYRTSTADPNIADPAESVLLVIPQPYSNHNGGMIEFGPDGYLYIGMGDGGAGYDPGDRAQNPFELLGKILRIDVDASGPAAGYAIPPSNPFFDSSLGLPEIYSLGMRNPWRFSFDRATGRLYAGDVGQANIEEIDIIAAGGNYGWRVWEGSSCTGLGPAPCSSPGFIPPIAEYDHSFGRCSITGGYVYRGNRGSLPFGAYIYGDFCTGEIFMLNAGIQSMLLQTGLNISSFGEDEDGEIYVVGWGGTVNRIINPNAPSQPTFYVPRLETTTGRAAGQDESMGFGATNLEPGTTTLTFRAYDRNGQLITGEGISNPGTIELAGGEQMALLDTQIFGSGFRAQDRAGWIKLESSRARLSAFFLAFDARLSFLAGAGISSILSNRFVFPETESADLTQIFMSNPNPVAADVSLELLSADGTVRTSLSCSLLPNQALADTAANLFPGFSLANSDYIRGNASQGISAFEFLGKAGQDARGLNAEDATAGAPVLYCPQYVVGGGYRSTISVTNLEVNPGTVTFQLFKDDGQPAASPHGMSIAGRGKVFLSDPAVLRRSRPVAHTGICRDPQQRTAPCGKRDLRRRRRVGLRCGTSPRQDPAHTVCL